MSAFALLRELRQSVDALLHHVDEAADAAALAPDDRARRVDYARYASREAYLDACAALHTLESEMAADALSESGTFPTVKAG